MDDDTLARSLHDLGLAAWFGGSLMGAIGLNGKPGLGTALRPDLLNRPGAHVDVTTEEQLRSR